MYIIIGGFMQNDLEGILKPDAVKKYQDRPASEILQAPLGVLNFLSEGQITKLNAHKISTLGDLVDQRNRLGIVGVQIDPRLIGRLICILLYPQHDSGPDCDWERLFQSAPLNYYINFPHNPFHTRFGPVFYRGRLDGSARVLVIGQDPSTDEILAHRVFIGQAGQLAQNFLTRLGLTRSYLMFNTFLFGVQSSSLSAGTVTPTDATIMAYRNSLFDRAAATNNLTAIIAFGQHANTSAMNWPGRGSIPIVHLTHPTAPSGVAANWNSHFAAAQSAIAPDGDGHVDSTPYSTMTAIPSTDIPRRDLPFGIPSWHGMGGSTRSQRGSGATFESQITWTAP
jgi:uracil-DNA glycosylase